MTDCGLECDSNQCILDCWAKFLDAHRDCPCEVSFLNTIDPSCFCMILFDLQSRQIVPMVVHVKAMNAMESAQGLKLTVQSQLEKVKRLKISQ